MKLRNHILAFAIAVLVLPGASRAAATNETAAWLLLPTAQVESSGVFLDQLVKLEPATMLPQVRLAPAPALGQSIVFSRKQIVDLIQQHASGLSTTNWSGAAQIRVTRRSRQLAQAELGDLLTATLQAEYVKDKGELELHHTRPWVPVLVPDEPLTLKVTEMPATGVNPNFIVRFELWNGPELIGNWQLPVLARVWRDIPVAHSPLLRGELLRDADVTLVRRDVLACRDAFLGFPTPDASLELAENLAEGLPVLNRSVHIRPAIRRGRLVEGVFQDGSLSISLKVETLEDGLLGQTVRVRNPKTKRELLGKVQNEQTILIAL